MAKRKPGKYDHLFAKLKPLPPQDLKHQERVEDMKKLLRRCDSCEGCGKVRSVDEPSDTYYIAENAPDCGACDGTGRKKLTGQSLAAMYVIARALKEQLEQAVSDANLELEAATQLLVASQEQGQADWGAFGASDRAVKMTNGDAIRVQPEVFAMVRDKNTFREWCYTNGLRSRMELPEKPTTDLVKARLLNGDTEPKGIEVYVRTRIVYTPMKTEVTSSDEQPQADDTTIF